jgi:hypothetical protein
MFCKKNMKLHVFFNSMFCCGVPSLKLRPFPWENQDQPLAYLDTTVRCRTELNGGYLASCQLDLYIDMCNVNVGGDTWFKNSINIRCTSWSAPVELLQWHQSHQWKWWLEHSLLQVEIHPAPFVVPAPKVSSLCLNQPVLRTLAAAKNLAYRLQRYMLTDEDSIQNMGMTEMAERWESIQSGHRDLTSPRYFCTNSDPTTRMKATVVWWATALASIVLPVPGGPYNKTPGGGAGGSIPICM